MKVIDQQVNKAGLPYRLGQLENGNMLVMVLKTNYVRGRDVSKWFFCNKPRQCNNDFQRMVKEGLPEAEARAMFKRKLNGKKKN